VVAAFGSAYLYWLLCLLMAIPVSSVLCWHGPYIDLSGSLAANGPLLALLAGGAGALGGLILVLALICLGLNLRVEGWGGIAAIVTTGALFVQPLGQTFIVSFGWHISHDWLCHPGWGGLLLILMVITLPVLLYLSSLNGKIRLVCCLGFLPLIHALALAAFIPIASWYLDEVYLGLLPFSLGSAIAWQFDVFSLFNPRLLPGGFIVDQWSGSVLFNKYALGYSESWLPFLRVIIAQVFLVFGLLPFVRRAASTWRTSAE